MKKLITAVAVMLITISAFAQQKKDDTLHKAVQPPVEQRKENSFTPEQRERMAALRSEYKAKYEAVKNSSNTSEEKRKQMMELRKEEQKARMEIYTPEQKEVAKKRMEERKTRMSKSGNHSGKNFDKKNFQGRRKGNHDRNADLNLTQEQKLKMQSINKESREKLTRLRNDSSLTEESKKSAIKKIREDQRQQVDALLTAEQKEKMKTRKAGAHKKSVPRENKNK